MSKTRLYRFTSGGLGIYEAIEKDCPGNDPRRAAKPDGSWLPRVGTQFPGAISFWTELGLKKYRESGLLAWHASVVTSPIEVKVADIPADILYQDEFQIICSELALGACTSLSLEELL
jgi:hypothetical protein